MSLSQVVPRNDPPQLQLARGLRQCADAIERLFDAEPPAEWIGPEKAIEILGGDMTRRRLYRITKGHPCRQDLNRSTKRFERAGLERLVKG